MRLPYVLGMAYIGVCLAAIASAPRATALVHPDLTPFVTSEGSGGEWFRTIRPHCNPVEVETRHEWSPPPDNFDGIAYSAACYALAGYTNKARTLLRNLPTDDQWRGAGVVFNVGHPVADAGNDRAASPIMELVVEFWPNHYMALYHAGSARFALGEHGPATDYLERFLKEYPEEDGWVAAAESMLQAMDDS